MGFSWVKLGFLHSVFNSAALISRRGTFIICGIVSYAYGATAQEIDLNLEDAVSTTTQGPAIQDALPSEEALRASEFVERAAPLVRKTAPKISLVMPKKGNRVVQRLKVRKVNISDSAYLDDSEIDALTTLLIGRTYSQSQLDELASAYTQLYVDKNIALAQAIVSDVNYSAGTVDIELFEARLGEVRFNSKNISDEYLAFRLGVKSGDLADNRIIDERLLRLQFTDNLNVSANFSPGATQGLTDLDFNVQDAQRFTSSVTFDNYGSQSNGEYRATASASIASVTGWNDPLGLSYVYREGSQEFSASYRRVIHRDGASIQLSGVASQSKSLETTPIVGSAGDVTAALNIPIFVTENSNFSVWTDYLYFTEESKLAGINILDQQGHQGSINATYFQSGVGWSVSASGGYFLGSYDNGVLSTNNNNYSGYTGNISAAALLGKGAIVSLNLSGQKITSGTAPSKRLFTITSPTAVRGYPVSQSAGDSGYVMRFQLETAEPYKFGGDDFAISPFMFYDAGEALDSAGINLGLASSIGTGLSFNFKQNLFGDIYVAKPLTTDIVGYTNPSTDPIVRFSVSARF